MDFGNSNISTVCTVKRPILHNLAKFREDRSIHCCDIAIFVIFQDGCRRRLVFFKLEILTICPLYGPICASVRNFIKIDQTALRYGDLTVFQNGGRPPSWICRARIGTTREDYLVVFIVEQNLVGIAAVLSII